MKKEVAAPKIEYISEDDSLGQEKKSCMLSFTFAVFACASHSNAFRSYFGSGLGGEICVRVCALWWRWSNLESISTHIKKVDLIAAGLDSNFTRDNNNYNLRSEQTG